MSPSPFKLLIIGNDPGLSLLLRRYAEQSGCQLTERALTPGVATVRQWQPDAIIFLSLDHLQTAQALVDDLAAHETPVLVCASVADEARARELGADAGLLHPLTYEHFLEVLAAVGPPQPG
jgi:CheY-like chemotaxis protein